MQTEARKRTSERARAGAIIRDIDSVEWTAGQTIGGRYRLVRALDRKGRIWRVTDNQDRSLVLKRGSPTVVEREFRVLSSLSHPNMIQTIGLFEDDAGSYVALEYLTGGDLVSLAGLAPERWLNQIVEIIDALAYLHRRHIVHRDLKPSNVLLDESSCVRLIDFESALTVGSRWTAGGTTSILIPPGRGNAPVSVSDDLYALASLLHEMLYGRPPGTGARKACPSRVKPLAELVDRSLRPSDPALRPDLAGFLAVVELVQANGPDLQ
jgi:serine/threonine protein kinase